METISTGVGTATIYRGHVQRWNLGVEVNWEQRSQEAVSRLSDSRWIKVQRIRRWLKVGSWAWALAALLFGCVFLLQGYALGQLALADAAKIRAQAAEIRRQIDVRECQQFPASCRDRRSVFFQRSKLQPEKNTWKRR